jgi:hypothetical protein
MHPLCPVFFVLALVAALLLLMVRNWNTAIQEELQDSLKTIKRNAKQLVHNHPPITEEYAAKEPDLAADMQKRCDGCVMQGHAREKRKTLKEGAKKKLRNLRRFRIAMVGLLVLGVIGGIVLLAIRA